MSPDNAGGKWRCGRMTVLYRQLSDFADVKGGKRLPQKKNLISTPTAHPYIRVRNLGTEKILELSSAYEYVDEETYKIISHYTVNQDDVIISIVGTIGLIAIIGKSLNGANLTENCAKLINIKGLNRDFLYYFLTSNSGQNAIKVSTVGAVQAKLPLKNIQTIPIPDLPMEKQRDIAATLSCLDDKIELNNRINANLEAQAQAVFKSWFVDFEPFKDGEFVDSELGEIPKGWQKVEFSSFLTPRVEKSNDPTIPLFSVTDTGIYLRGDKFNKTLSKAETKNKIAHETDIVFGMSREILNWGIMHSPLGAVSSAYNVFAVNPCINSKYLEYFIKVHASYFRNLIRPAAREGQGVDKIALFSKIVYIPPTEVLAKYYAIETLLMESIQVNFEESRTLAAIRDTLLPRLMSGKLEVEND
jgi:type I restriction enzyme S subunit